MIGDGILPDDLVVIRPQATANQGEIIAALLGEEATVKRINYTTKGITLDASNPAYAPIRVDQDDARIIGRVVGLIRDYDRRAF